MSTNVAPFTVQPKLTQIAMAVKPTGLIADLVCPRVPVEGEKFIYTKFTTDEMFTIPDTKVGRTSEPNQVEFGGVDVTDSTEDHGLDDVVPNKDIKNAQGTNYDPEAMAAENTATLVELAREKRVANLYFTLGNYLASQRATLSGTSQWSDFTNSDPLSYILNLFDGMLIRPNVAILGQLVWTKLRTHPKIVSAVLNSAAGAGGLQASGIASRAAVAALLELDDIHVGSSFANASKPGQTATYSRLWGKHAAFMKLEKGVRNARSPMPTFGFTAQWGERVAGTIDAPQKGLEGSRIVRVGEHVKELICFQEAGFLVQNAIA